MEVTDEMLAAYAEGNTSDIEHKAVREYLIHNPDELETVLIMMDKDFELTPTEETPADSLMTSADAGVMEDISYSAAAFAPNCMSKSVCRPQIPKLGKSVFKGRLNDLLDELNL